MSSWHYCHHCGNMFKCHFSRVNGCRCAKEVLPEGDDISTLYFCCVPCLFADSDDEGYNDSDAETV